MKHQHYSVSHEGHQVLPFSWETINKNKRIELESQNRKAMPMSWPEIPRDINCQYQARHLVPSVSWHRGSGH